MTDQLSTDVATWQTVLAGIYTPTKASPVMVVDGYGLHVGVKNNQLVLTDGVGTHRRTRRLARADRTVRRLVILGRSGTVTLAALRWCTDVGISVSLIDPDGSLTAVTASPNPRDARLLRAQALAHGTPVGTDIARRLLQAKLAGHAAVLDEHFAAPEAAHTQRDDAARMDSLHTVDALREIEAHAAIAYFAVWTVNVRAAFATRDRARVPLRWTQAAPRRSPLTNGGSPRKAADPVNALLNYAYTLGESVTRHACQIVGLDPALGVMHTDKPHRDSLALDILETLRPTIDRTVLQLLAARHFRYLDFTQTPQGQVRLTEAVTHPLAASMPAWAAAVGPIVESVSRNLAQAAPGNVTGRTPLTRAGHTAANRKPFSRRTAAPASPPTAPATCRDCGTALAAHADKLCPSCWIPERARLATARAARGRASRNFTRQTTGQDPTQTVAARQKRSDALRRERALRDAWAREHPHKASDRAEYDHQVFPLLAAVSLSEITSATGMGLSAASKVRRGLLLPHARHWECLALLGTPSLTPTSP